MPQYMLLIYVPADREAPPDEGQAWVEYTQNLAQSGALVAGDALEWIDSATTVRLRDGETMVTDGPFAETKEYLGGYYVIDVPDLDAALGWAAKLPHMDYGSTEVRPVMVTPATAGSASGGQGAPAQA
jgi:hypothetical protein